MNLTHELTLVAPLVLLGVGAIAIMLLDTILPTRWPRAFCTVLLMLAALVSLNVLYIRGDFLAGQTVFGGMLYVDSFGAFATFIILFGGILALLLGANRNEEEGIETPGEFYALFLISTFGAVMFVNAAELITLFLALETMSLALYCLCGSALGGSDLVKRRSAESALKYFLLGSFSSALMLYGLAVLYGLTGTTVMSELATRLATVDSRGLLALGLGLSAVGFFFKVAGVPFHFWAPDVYQGAPTSITSFMACVVKAASVAAMVRLLWGALGSQILFWSGAVWYVALASMVLGNLLALRQRSVKRMLAYSSISNAGYLLMAVLAPGEDFGGGAAILYYLLGYTVMTMGSLAVVSILAEPHRDQSNADDISRFNGLGKSEPLLAGVMSLFLLALAGLPPGMVGLVGKIYLFAAAIKADYVGLAIVGILASAVGCFYYLRVIVAMYFVEGDKESEAASARTVVGTPLLSLLLICAVGVVLLGVFPSLVYDHAALALQLSSH